MSTDAPPQSGQGGGEGEGDEAPPAYLSTDEGPGAAVPPGYGNIMPNAPMLQQQGPPPSVVLSTDVQPNYQNINNNNYNYNYNNPQIQQPMQYGGYPMQQQPMQPMQPQYPQYPYPQYPMQQPMQQQVQYNQYPPQQFQGHQLMAGGPMITTVLCVCVFF